MFFRKIRTALHVYKVVDSGVNSLYTIKISSGIGMPQDTTSDARAKNEIVRMILSGEIDKGDSSEICKAYMQARESILMGEGRMVRWVRKGE